MSGRYICSIGRPPLQMGPPWALVLVPTTVPGMGIGVPAPAKDLLRAGESQQTPLRLFPPLNNVGRPYPIIIISKVVALKTVQTLNKGRELAIIRCQFSCNTIERYKDILSCVATGWDNFGPIPLSLSQQPPINLTLTERLLPLQFS